MIQKVKKYKLYIILFILFMVIVPFAEAQNVTVKAQMDTTEFLIGDQVGLELIVKHKVTDFVGIPDINEDITNQIEFLEQSENDTSLLETGEFLIKKRFLITAFDSGYYVLPPIPFLYYSDTLKTEPLLFKVHTIPVDTSEAIKDIKMPYGAPLSFAEVMPWAFGGLGAVLVIFILVYVIRKLLRKEPIIKRFKVREPAHIVAYRELSKLKEDKLWQKDKIKEYYTVLTDILRLYLWNRYTIRTLERTSEEILVSLQISNFEDDEAYNALKEIFYISDLVKFAKYKPVIDEHDKCMNWAYEFIDRTKLIEDDIEKIEDVESTQVENKETQETLEKSNIE